MQCPGCDYENPAGVKFCGECGTRLDRPCPDCGVANPPTNKFLGDGFMALLGVPLAQEDHARRVMLAALGIRRSLNSIDAGFELGRAHLALAQLSHYRGEPDTAAHRAQADEIFRELDVPVYVGRPVQLAHEAGVRLPR